MERARGLGCRVEVIPRASFDHGGTRNLGAARVRSQFLVFMTQDALPADAEYLARLLAPLRNGCAAAYARQIPYPSASPLERYHREFGYPPESHVRGASDLPRLGVGAARFSNVASAVDRVPFTAVGGFPDGTILNEDVMLAFRLMRAGYRVAYAADARVYHSHNYHLGQQFRRYFDIGASQAQAGALPTARHGSRFAYGQIRALLRQHAWVWLPRAAVELVAKWVAFQLGRRHRRLPLAVVRRCSLQPAFWARTAVAVRAAAAAAGTPPRP